MTKDFSRNLKSKLGFSLYLNNAVNVRNKKVFTEIFSAKNLMVTNMVTNMCKQEEN